MRELVSGFRQNWNRNLSEFLRDLRTVHIPFTKHGRVIITVQAEQTDRLATHAFTIVNTEARGIKLFVPVPGATLGK